MDFEDGKKIPNTVREYLTSGKESIRMLAWIWKHLQNAEQKFWIRKMSVFLFLMVVTQTLNPFAVSYIFKGLEKRNSWIIIWGILGSFTLIFLQKLFDYKKAIYRERVLSLLQENIDSYITRQLFEKSLGQHAHHSSILNVGNIDKGRWKLLELQSQMLYDGFQVIITLALSYTLLFLISPISGLFITFAVIANIGWTFFLNHKVVIECTSIEKRFRKLNRWIVELWEKVERVKTSGKTNQMKREITAEFKSISQDDVRFWHWFIGQNYYRDVVTMTTHTVVVAYGAWQAYHGKILYGDLYPIYAWSGAVVMNIWNVSRIEHMINWNMPSIKSKLDALVIPPEATDSNDAIEISKDESIVLDFRNVSYLYPEKSGDEGKDEVPHALRHVTFSVGLGEKVAIIGKSGAGKSTLMKLALRSMDPTNGEVYVNGLDLRNVKYDSWMRAIGYIPQKPQVFDGTIRYNMMYGVDEDLAKEITDEAIWELMGELQIDFGKRLRNGLYTQVGHNGIELSGGQAQRLIIGAAAIKSPRIMLIDEATSSLDPTTERKVQAGLAKLLTKDVSAVVIAHRLSTVRHLCTKFVVLKSTDDLKEEDSQVEACASSFEELYEISPTFRMLWDDQEIKLEERIVANM
ncbi:ABC transporter ATP-binding protein [Patescibacteria group bacterium]|nr:ABC transporter ATP-binding protein [Patescibacteria group bacterium]